MTSVERTWPRVTYLDCIDEPLHAFRTTDPSSMGRRVLYALLIGLGITLTAFGSLVFTSFTGPIPYKVVPDIRPILTMGSGIFLGMQAAWGGAKRRRLALYGAIAFVIGFHLEEATVHWIGPFTGSITGTRVGLLGTGGSLLALLGVLIMHVEVESERLRQDSVKRGASEGGAADLATGLRRQGVGRLVSLTLGVAGLALFVSLAQHLFGNESSGGAWVLLLGGGLLLLLAHLFTRWATQPAATEGAR